MSDLLSFIEKSPSAYHAVEACVQELKKNQFKELNEKTDFKVKKGGRYFVLRDSGALIAFIVPQKELSSARYAQPY